ncbi:MAG: type II toxin-antitoxin system VapC family toxin [Rhodospirillales bacterium]|nr:type II toxin-antitoxin system VapC family toxin [Rhodospirillales bacterium]MDE0378798.1 type II toxin-antitoxin system VapC family toxin [Rhodospirillales bacterium]
MLDTHVLVWAVEGDRRLGTNARAAIEAAERAEAVGISAVTPWEIALLAERNRLRLVQEVGTWIEAVLALPGMRLMPIEPAVALDSVRLPGPFHADPADRLIIATARHSGARLVTADGTILSYAKRGHVDTIDARL